MEAIYVHAVSNSNNFFFQFIFITPGDAENEVDKRKIMVLSGLR